MQTKSKHAFLLDTHVWFRHHSSPAMLSENVTATIDEAVSRRSAYVSAISVWELALQERKGRLQLEGGALQWTHDSLARLGLSLLPLSPEVLIESVYLAKPMHKDPGRPYPCSDCSG